MAFGSEEAWWMQNQGGYGAGQDRAVDLLQSQKAMDVDQTRRRGDADLANKQNMGDIYGEMPGKVLDAYYKGSEENRRGKEFEQLSDLRNKQEGRAETAEERAQDKYDYDKGNRHFEQSRLGSEEAARQMEDAYRNEKDQATGRTKYQQSQDIAMDTSRQGLENSKVSNQFTRAQMGNLAQQQAYTAEDRQTARFKDLSDVAVAQATSMEENLIAGGADPKTAHAQAQDYLQGQLASDPTFGKLPPNQKQLFMQGASQQLAAKKSQQKSSSNMLFNASPEGQRYQQAATKMTAMEQAATAAIQDANTLEGQIIGVGGFGYTRDAGTQAKETAAQRFERAGDPAAAAQIRNSLDANTADVIRDISAQKMQQAAQELRDATVGADPAQVQAGLAKAADLERKAQAMRGSGPQQMQTLQGSGMNPGKPQGMQQAGGMAPPPNDTLGLFTKSTKQQKRAGYP